MSKNLNLAKAFKIIRKKRKLNQVDFAKLIGVSQSIVPAYEKGTKKPTMDRLNNICERLDMPPYMFLFYANDSNDELTDLEQIFMNVAGAIIDLKTEGQNQEYAEIQFINTMKTSRQRISGIASDMSNNIT